MSINPNTGEPYDRVRPTDGKVIKDYIDPGIIKKLKQRGLRSPDISKLKFYKEIPLFVYGTEMIGGDDDMLLTGAKFLGMAHTITPNFVMKANNAFPVVFPCKVDDQRKGNIRGEMYLVSPEHIIAMDAGNSNRKSFNRVKARFVLEDQEDLEHLKVYKQAPYMPGYFYIGNTDWWSENNSGLSLRPRHHYSGSIKSVLGGKIFYEWTNFPDDENDEWGYRGDYQGNFWGRNVRTH